MAVWRTKAGEMFGFAPSKYSFSRGKVELFADLLHLAARSADDPATLDRIVEYVTWTTPQTSDELDSAVDLAFLLPMLRDESLLDLFGDRFSREFLAAKRASLMEDPP